MKLTRLIICSLVLVSAFSARVFACEALLKASEFQLLPNHIQTPERFQNLRSMMNRNVFFPIPTSKGGFYSVIFDPSHEHKNQGYILRGWIQGQRYTTDKVNLARPEDERKYFHAVAVMHGLKDEAIQVKSANGCESIVVHPWIQAKLWLKHSLKLADIREILQSGRGAKVYEYHSGNDHRYRINSFDKRGQPIAIVIAETAECPHALVTAFTEVDESDYQ